MLKNTINDVLKDTLGEIKYVEQLMTILVAAGFAMEECDIIRKAYAKKQIDKIAVYEVKIRKLFGDDLADTLIDNIRRNSVSMYYKAHEVAYLASLPPKDSAECNTKAIWILLYSNNINKDIDANTYDTKNDAHAAMKSLAEEVINNETEYDFADNGSPLEKAGIIYSIDDTSASVYMEGSNDLYYWKIKELTIKL